MEDKQDKHDKNTVKQFKEEVSTLLIDYIDIKKEAANLGYDKDLFKFKDYIDYYIRLK